MAESWRLNGKVLVACNCDWGCPCNFNAPPTTGKCEGGWTWHVEEGSSGDIRLDGLNFSVYVNWPGAIHEGNGEALVLIDERAEAAQRTAIEKLVGGKVGGPWAVLAWTWPKVHGPYASAYDLAFDGVKTRMRCGEYVEVECGPIRNPATGAESYPGVSLPQESSSSARTSARRLASACPTASNTIIQVSTWRSARSSTRGREWTRQYSLRRLDRYAAQNESFVLVCAASGEAA